MNIIKNILLVSYLKNKGVRRICFVFGLILFLPSLIICNDEIGFGYYSFKNIDDVRGKSVGYLVQHTVYEKYPFDLPLIKNFHDWQMFFMYEGTDENKLLKYFEEICKDTTKKEDPQFEIETPDKTKHTIKNICAKLQEYKEQPIKVWTYRVSKIPILLFPLISFYLLFIICCIVKWIYKGFKGE